MSKPKVTISPTVLLSVTDHYRRMNGDRVIGILLGEKQENIKITSSYALPFTDTKNWFIDTSYINELLLLNNKITNNENIVGWYHTGPNLYQVDLEITEYFNTFCEDAILAVIDVKKENELPVACYYLERNYDEIDESQSNEEENYEVDSGIESGNESDSEHEDKNEIKNRKKENNEIIIKNKSNEKKEKKITEKHDLQFMFNNLKVSIEGEEAEEVGVEHLLRDVRDPSNLSFSHEIISGLKVYANKLEIIINELKRIIELKNTKNISEEFLFLISQCLNDFLIDDVCKQENSQEVICAVTKSFILGNDLVKNRAE